MIEPMRGHVAEMEHRAVAGLPVLVMSVLGVLALAGLVVAAAATKTPKLFIGTVPLGLAAVFGFAGLFKVDPNEGMVLQLFGRYAGTVKAQGLWWANPFFSKRGVSLRTRNFETEHLKVNDSDGNPIEIAAVVVWNVVDSARAVFEVDAYESFVRTQSEAALRNLATRHPYDAHSEKDTSLRGHTARIADELKAEIHDRVAQAGVEIREARISHLAYAPEIAQAMLQRQQAGAIIAARQKIVDGAVGMVEMALERLAKNNVVQLDDERKAAMVSNLLVVLCGERSTQPVVNTGTIYH